MDRAREDLAMREYLEIGPCPHNEVASQLGEPNYSVNARRECWRFIEAIRKTLGPEPEGAELTYRRFTHEFGTYLEVICWFDLEQPASVEYAFRCENEAPATWTEAGVAPPTLVRDRSRPSR